MMVERKGDGAFVVWGPLFYPFFLFGFVMVGVTFRLGSGLLMD
jgi:hypothetical protein